MKQSKFTGLFRDYANGSNYEITVYCFSFLEAFFLLTAEAISSGRHYQLYSISKEGGSSVRVDDIKKVTNLFL